MTLPLLPPTSNINITVVGEVVVVIVVVVVVVVAVVVAGVIISQTTTAVLAALEFMLKVGIMNDDDDVSASFLSHAYLSSFFFFCNSFSCAAASFREYGVVAGPTKLLGITKVRFFELLKTGVLFLETWYYLRGCGCCCSRHRIAINTDTFLLINFAFVVLFSSLFLLCLCLSFLFYSLLLFTTQIGHGCFFERVCEQRMCVLYVLLLSYAISSWQSPFSVAGKYRNV